MSSAPPGQAAPFNSAHVVTTSAVESGSGRPFHMMWPHSPCLPAIHRLQRRRSYVAPYPHPDTSQGTKRIAPCPVRFPALDEADMAQEPRTVSLFLSRYNLAASCHLAHALGRARLYNGIYPITNGELYSAHTLAL